MSDKKPSERLFEIRREMKELRELELFYKYGVNDINISSLIAYLDEQHAKKEVKSE